MGVGGDPSRLPSELGKDEVWLAMCLRDGRSHLIRSLLCSDSDHRSTCRRRHLHKPSRRQHDGGDIAPTTLRNQLYPSQQFTPYSSRMTLRLQRELHQNLVPSTHFCLLVFHCGSLLVSQATSYSQKAICRTLPHMHLEEFNMPVDCPSQALLLNRATM